MSFKLSKIRAYFSFLYVAYHDKKIKFLILLKKMLPYPIKWVGTCGSVMKCPFVQASLTICFKMGGDRDKILLFN